MCVPAFRTFEEFPSRSQAEDSCNNDDECPGFYDWKCEGILFTRCTKGYPNGTSGDGSCLYLREKRPGKFLPSIFHSTHY